MGALGAVLVAALGLRFAGYATTPALTDNADEVDWAWSGLTLITRHVPFGWSYLPAYAHPVILQANATSYPIVHPYLDHPPLFSLLIGLWAWAAGARQLTDVNAGMIRPPAILLSVLAIGLAYGLGRRLLGRRPALAGVALLATAPGAVLLGREVESEALLGVLLLAALLCTLRVLDGEGGAGTLAGLGLCCLLAPLVKVPGLAVGGIAAAVLAGRGHRPAAALAAVAAVAGLGGYALYGELFDGRLFLAVVADQGARRHGVMSAWEFVAAPAGVNRHLRDGWWLLGWLGIGGLLARGARARTQMLLAWPVLAFSAALLVLADERVISQYGWYREAVYPLVYLAAGGLAWQAVVRPALGRVAALLVLGGASASTAALGAPGAAWMPGAGLLGLIVALLLGSVVAAGLVRRPGWGAAPGWAAGVALVLMLALNVATSLRLPEVQGIL